MATIPASRPDLAGHREALRLPIPEIVKQLVGLIGRKLTAYVGGGYPFSSNRRARVDSATILPATVTRTLPSAGEIMMG
jgi:hypothetical protein